MTFKPRIRFFRGHWGVAAAMLAAGILTVGYLASYPIGYRLLIGPDADRERSVEFLQWCCLCESPTEDAVNRYETWQRLETCYYPPATWLIDNTPLRHPILIFAWLADVDEQLQGEISSRDFGRQIQQARRTGGDQAVIELLKQSVRELQAEHSTGDDDWSDSE